MIRPSGDSTHDGRDLLSAFISLFHYFNIRWALLSTATYIKLIEGIYNT